MIEKWRVTCYYGSDAKAPKVPGEMAIQTVHADDASRDVEVAAAKSRADTGRVTVEEWSSVGWSMHSEDRRP
jgi:hypothetical protein